MALAKKRNKWYIFFRSGKKIKWVKTGETDEEKAREFHDDYMEKRKRDLKEEFQSQLLGIKPVKKIEISEIWEEYEKLKEPSKMARVYFPRFKSWITSEYPKIEYVDKISISMAREFLDSQGKGKTKITGKTYNTMKSAYSAIWKQLAIYNIENIWLQIPNKKIDSKPFRAFSDDEIKTILKAVPAGFWHDATIVSLYTGLRLKDLVFLKTEHVKNNNYIEVTPHKTERYKRAVVIWMHGKVKEALVSRLDNEGYVFPEAVKRYGGGAFNHFFPDLLEKNGIHDTDRGKASFHSLRATFITRCEKSGIPRKIIQGIVGHNSPKMTGRYNDDIEASKVIMNLV